MTIKEKLNLIGKIIAGILIIIIFIQFLIVWNTKCDINNIDTVGGCITGLIMIIIPTEVSIVQTLESFPYLMIGALIFYWKFVSPNLEQASKNP